MAKKVLVLAGGFSAEREVSLVTGKCVCEALKKAGYEVIFYDWRNGFELVEVLKKERPDVVFNALHGNWGEDGEIQGFLDVLQIPYTHSGLRASVLGMDKFLTKELAQLNNIKVPQGEKKTFAEFKLYGTQVPMPYVLKPVSDGSSVGVYIIRKTQDLAQVSYEDDREILVEKFIDGQELTCMVLEGKAYVVTELRASDDFYDYHAKYTDGVTKHILPAEIPAEVADCCKNYAEKLHRVLGCSGVSRCDFRYNPKDGVVLLEINTAPGMTNLSLVPEQAKYIGTSYEQLCAGLVEAATCRKIV